MERLESSVIICAYTLDRWEHLAAGVEAAARQTRLDGGGEVVLVIDHNEELAKRAQEELGDRALVIENRYERGLSGARNSGIEAAQGDLVAFLDDDALPADGWLQALLAPFGEPAVAATGGVARPVWGEGRPGWFPEEFDWVVGCSYRGQAGASTDVPAVTDVRNPLGCNMAFRRSVFADIGGFREGIGRVGRYPLGCEETELCIRLRQAQPGARIVLVPDAVVDHHVTGERHRFGYFARRCFAEGISKAAVTGQVGATDGLSSERTYVTRALPRGMARGLASAFGGDRPAPGRLAGPRRSGAIFAGVVLAAAGYARGRTARTSLAGRDLAERSGTGASAGSISTGDRTGPGTDRRAGSRRRGG